MDRAKTAIIHRLSSKMSIVHPWMICFDLPMPYEVSDLLNKEILGLTRFGIDTPSSVTITFQTWEDYRISTTSSKIVVGLESNLVKEKERQSLLWTPRRRKQLMVYNVKEQFLRAKFFMDTGIRMGLVRISQQWIEDARLNHSATSFVFWRILEANNEEQITGNCLFQLLTSSYITWPIYPKYHNKYFPNTSLTKTCQPLCLDDNEKDRMATMDHAIIPYFSQFFWKTPEIAEIQFLLGTLLPPVTLDLINFSKNCDFSSFSQFLEKLQFLLDTLLPPVPLDLTIINFSKNCDFSNFSQFLEESQKLQKSQFLLDTLVPPVTLDLIHRKLEARFYCSHQETPFPW